MRVNLDDNKLFGLRPQRDEDTYLINTKKQQKFVIWDNHNELPFLQFVSESSRTAFGLFLLTSNPAEIQITPDINRLTYRILGDGIFDLYIYDGPSLKDVIAQHYKTIGYSQLPSYWSLGYQQSKVGYKLSDLSKVTQGFLYNNLPIDSFWNYIEYSSYIPFEIDQEAFNQKVYTDQIQKLQDQNIKYGLTLFSSLKYDSKHDEKESFAQYLRNGIYDLILIQQDKVQSQVPNFCNEQANIKWKNSVQQIVDVLKLDGIWLDMNQPYVSRITGSVPQFINSDQDNYIFTPGSIDLEKHTLPLKLSYASYYSNICFTKNYNKLNELNLHLINRVFQAKNTYESMQSFNIERPFILSSAYFNGMNQYASKFIISEQSDWQSMRQSLRELLRYQSNGAIISGTSVCGTQGEVDQQLCIRWHQLSALSSPVFRNHYDKIQQQEPFSISIQATELIRQIIELRYSLLAYIYTQLYSSVQNGYPLVRSMIYEFKNDVPIDGTDIFSLESQFMLGPSILVSPVLTEGYSFEDQQIIQKIYIPNETFYNLFTGEKVNRHRQSIQLNIDKISDIPIYIRGGSIIPFQNVTEVNQQAQYRSQKVLNTKDLKNKMTLELLIAFNQTNQSQGTIILDDGESAIEKQKFTEIEIIANKRVVDKDKVQVNILIQTNNNQYNTEINTFIQQNRHLINQLKIYGISDKIYQQQVQIKNLNQELTFTYQI